MDLRYVIRVTCKERIRSMIFVLVPNIKNSKSGENPLEEEKAKENPVREVKTSGEQVL